jgi:hypothetical protein
MAGGRAVAAWWFTRFAAVAVAALMVMACGEEFARPGALWAQNDSDQPVVVRQTDPSMASIVTTWTLEPHERGTLFRVARGYQVEVMDPESCRVVAGWFSESEDFLGVLVEADSSVHFLGGEDQLPSASMEPISPGSSCRAAPPT